MAVDLSRLKQQFNGRLQTDVPVKNYTTLEIGGPAAGFIEIENTEELISIIKAANNSGLPYLVIGEGSNLLVSDEPLDLVIIKNHSRGIRLDDKLVIAQSGSTLQSLVDFTVQHGLSGMQKLTGIPGTLGGAIFGNAGAYGQTVSDFLEEVTCFDPKSSEKLTLNKNECSFSYRDSGFKRTCRIILEARFCLPPGNPDDLKTKSGEILKLRLDKYRPGIKCPGSFFKNIFASELTAEALAKIPPEKIVYGKIPSGYLLEAVGARGMRRGNIEVAPFHGNVIMNLGGGTARDFWRVAREVFDRVRLKFNLELEPEVQMINLPPFTASS